MTIVYQFLVAAALIAVMILVRIFADRRVIRQRLACGHSDGPGGNCSKTDCPEQNEEDGSACHAP